MTISAERFVAKGARALALATILAQPAAAQAQDSLTGTLPRAIPAEVAFRWGSLLLTPGLSVQQLGWDSNVFDEPNNPKRDFVFSVTPDLRAYVEGGAFQIISTLASEFNYFKEYESERSINRQVRARFDFVPGRLRPSVAGAYIQTRSRPSQEIDLRARRVEKEISASLAYEISPDADIVANVSRINVDYFEGEVFRGVDLERALTRTTTGASLGVRLPVTPLTTIQLLGGLSRDRFPMEAIRNTETKFARAEVEFGQEAMIRGRANVGFRNFEPVDPTVESFQGITAGAGLTLVLETGTRFDFGLVRDVKYSYDVLQAYYIESGADVAYRQRVFGPFDIQLSYGGGRLKYGRRDRVSERRDSYRSYGAGVGYNLRDQTRIAVNYEHAQRKSSEADARYKRPRFFVSWAYTF